MQNPPGAIRPDTPYLSVPSFRLVVRFSRCLCDCLGLFRSWLCQQPRALTVTRLGFASL